MQMHETHIFCYDSKAKSEDGYFAKERCRISPDQLVANKANTQGIKCVDASRIKYERFLSVL